MTALWQDVTSVDLVMESLFYFLGQSESLTFSETNKQIRAILKRLCFTSASSMIIDAHITQTFGEILCPILDYARLSVNDLKCATITTKAKDYLLQTRETNGLRHIGCHDDLMMLNSQLWTFWDRTPSTPTLGVFKVLQDVAAMNEDIKESWEAAIDRNVKYWKNSRVYGKFHVLFERPDGTILASVDTKKIYLVLGQAQSIGSLSMHPRTMGKKPKEEGKEVCIHKRISDFDFMIETTLLPWEGKIVYDGLLTGCNNPLSQSEKQVLLQLYKEAWNAGTIITSLPLKKASCSSSSSFSSSSSKSNLNQKQKDRIERCSKKKSMQLKALSKATVLPDFSSRKGFLWVVRRHGYCKAENPYHMVGILETAVDGSPPNFLVQAYSCIKLIPSLEEYVQMLASAVMARNGKISAAISIDVESAIEPLRSLFNSFNIKSEINWYPPPSDEESIQVNREMGTVGTVHSEIVETSVLNKSCCAVCRAPSRPDKGPLLQCSRCKTVAYCSKEHQKLHWSVHKKSCSK